MSRVDLILLDKLTKPEGSLLDGHGPVRMAYQMRLQGGPDAKNAAGKRMLYELDLEVTVNPGAQDIGERVKISVPAIGDAYGPSWDAALSELARLLRRAAWGLTRLVEHELETPDHARVPVRASTGYLDEHEEDVS